MMCFEGMPTTPFMIVKFLITNADENFWKLLYYTDIDALSHDALTPAQKSNMIWVDQKMEECNIFFTKLIEDYIPESKVIMKLFSNQANPINLYTSNILWAIEFLWGGEMSVVYNTQKMPCNRGDLLLYYFMKAINGKEVTNVGRIEFNYGRNRYDCVKSIYGNQTSYTGIALYLTSMSGSNGTATLDCESKCL